MLQKHTHYNQLAGQKIQRSEAIADGIFAVALTLLVLDIRVPLKEAIHSEADLCFALIALAPKFLSYLLSFVTLGIFWMAHTVQYTFIVRSDRHLTWLSILYLLFVSLLPFSTSLLSEYMHYKMAIGIYWLNIFALGATVYLHWRYAYKKDFLDPEIPNKAEVNHAQTRRILTAQTMYAIAAALCFINNYLSVLVTFAIQLNYAIAPRFKNKKL
ncbi:DUF1211 domain-containing protein [Leptospira semungkisensis]|uniref:DUF1211 domain-containing protein n=1 Tax=Leptospira semungkisensis TaxID=2484985 RepID=A0A4R9G0U3_9LEPT|nr:TMEM175 family protein [Leptospira semungkisensis]TGK04803.1 DUF1211 domain-containing protein [Leptospira semungkisensis]